MNLRIPPVFASAVLTVGLLAGCAGTAPAISAEASAQMQDSVVAIADAAAAGDRAGAVARLDELQRLLDEAIANGDVTAARAAAIQAAIDTVRADLQPPPAEPAPVETTEPVEPVEPAEPVEPQEPEESEAPEQPEPQEPAEPTQSPSPAPPAPTQPPQPQPTTTPSQGSGSG